MAEVFPFPPNWREPVRSRLSYLTDTLTAEDDTETRRMLRLIPSRRDAFTITPDAPALDPLLWAGQAAEWAVPSWPDATTLLEDVAAGSAVALPCDTADRGFRVGGLVVLARDPALTSLATVTAVAADRVTVDALTANWPAGATEILPAYLAGLSEDLRFARPALDTTELEVAFDATLGPDPGVAIASPTPAVFDVLDLNRREPPADTLARSVVRHASPTADFADYAQGPTPVGGRKDVLLSLDGRAEIAALRTWFHRVRGGYRAFWWPTWQADLRPAAPIGGDELVIEWMGYTARCFPHEARRHLAFVPYAGAVVHRRVVGAEDNGDGTETLTLDAAVSGAGISYVGFLLYVRASDTLELQYAAAEVAEARLQLTELPRQVPTSV